MIIEETYWEIDEHDLILGIVISGDSADWRIPLADLGDAIKAAQEARDGQRAQKPYPTT